MRKALQRYLTMILTTRIAAHFPHPAGFIVTDHDLLIVPFPKSISMSVEDMTINKRGEITFSVCTERQHFPRFAMSPDEDTGDVLRRAEYCDRWSQD